MMNENTNRTIKASLLFFILCLITNCKTSKSDKTEQQMKDYSEYKNIHEHQGTENYQVITIYNENSTINEKLIDQKLQFLSVIGRDEKQEKSNRKKIDFFGNIVGEFSTFKTLKNGTIWSIQIYSNWLTNGDETKYNYTEPFSNEKIKDIFKFKNNLKFKDWLPKFKELYSKSAYTHIHNSRYYFNIDNKWYLMDSYFEDRPKDFLDKYPAKEDQDIRMVKIRDVFDELRKTNQLKIIDYIEQDSEEGKGLNPVDFSAGYYMLELHLAQGDILKFRRYGGMGTEMEIYQIPKELGGSEEVFFIVQDPNPMYPKKSFGGMYAIRPKNYKKLPEYEATFKKKNN